MLIESTLINPTAVLRSNLTPPASNDEVFEPSGGFPKVAFANLKRRSAFSDELDMKPPPPSPLLSEASSELKRQPRGGGPNCWARGKISGQRLRWPST